MQETAIALAPVDYGNLTQILTAEQLAEDICQCCDAGASLVHFHVTDVHGRPTLDTSYFREVVKRVRARCDIIIEGSTGGVGVSPEIRSIALEVPDVELASLNMGSCNLFGQVYENPPDEVRRIARLMREKSIAPDMCFFDAGFFTSLDMLRAEGLVSAPLITSICLGFPGALPASIENLVFMVGKLPEDAVWTLVHHGFPDLSLLAAAIAGGGNVRVGFEDSAQLGSGTMATCNRELVEAMRDLIVRLGRKVATPESVRAQLGVS